MKVTWFPDWIKSSRLAIIGEKTKETLKEHNLLLVKNPNKNKSVIVRTLSIENAVFSEIEEMAGFIGYLESGEYILLSRILGNVLDISKDDWIMLKSLETNLFTYGTFLSAFWDFSNPKYPFLILPGSRHYILEEYHFKRAKLNGFVRIWPPGLSFPFIIPQDGGEVIGELYFDLPPSKFIELDRIEGEGYLYNRENVSVELLDAPFRGLKINAVTYIGVATLISEYPQKPNFDRLTFGDAYYIEREGLRQKFVVEEELFLKHIEGTIPMLITTYSPTLEKQYQGGPFDKTFETPLDELHRFADDLMKKIFLQSDEKQLPYLLIETLQNIWAPKILDHFNEETNIKGYIEITCNSFIERMQRFIKDCMEHFGRCLILILQSHSQEGPEVIFRVILNNEFLGLDLLIENLKSNYQLTYSLDKDKIIEDILSRSNIEQVAVIQIKIQEKILLNPFKRENLAIKLAEILFLTYN